MQFKTFINPLKIACLQKLLHVRLIPSDEGGCVTEVWW